MELDTIVCADALEYLKTLPDASVDAVITDPPYGTTAIEWDKAFDLQAWWASIKRITKPHSPIVMFGSQPFTSVLVCSNLKQFRHEWIWRKTHSGGFLHAKRMPIKKHEHILVFSRMEAVYNPQITADKPNKAHISVTPKFLGNNNDHVTNYRSVSNGSKFPNSVLTVAMHNVGNLHPTEKPIALMRYLVETYSNSGDLILDPFAGSGTTLVAAQQLGRHYIGCDLSAEYVELAKKRLELPFTVSMF